MFENNHDPREGASRYNSILVGQILRYPLLQIQDLYKLIHQGAMGSEHAVKDKDSVRIWLEKELHNLQEGPPEPIVDLISPFGEIVRVNLRPYLHAERNPDTLLDAFVKTANEYHGSEELLRKYWAHARGIASEGRLPFNVEKMDELLVDMEKDGFPPVHHSAAYEKAYRPAYRVVASIYIPELLGEEGNP